MEPTPPASVKASAFGEFKALTRRLIKVSKEDLDAKLSEEPSLEGRTGDRDDDTRPAREEV